LPVKGERLAPCGPLEQRALTLFRLRA